MSRVFRHVPVITATAWVILAKASGFEDASTRLASLALTAAALSTVYFLETRSEASPIHKGMTVYVLAATLVVWMWPTEVLPWLLVFPVTALYGVLFLVAVVPPILGKDMFTQYFARKSTPKAVWQTDVFLTINRHLTALWAVLFAAGMAASAVPGILGFQGLAWETFFEGALPAALMLLVGAQANRRYPSYYQKKLGLTPVGPQAVAVASVPGIGKPQPLIHFHKKEKPRMSAKSTIVAVNGSPHAEIGNTAMMLEMIRGALIEEECVLDVINLCKHDIDYCIGCGVCMEKGRCWISDDHHAIVERLLLADGVILASPVYFLHVTAQMKTFLDRSLAFGHKPRPTWKPGLAVSVSAGYGETQTAEYLASLLRVFGAFSVGRLTAMATGPGEFMGKPAVEARARDLGRDLARAVREERRYPATDNDLIFYRFMGALIRDHQDSIMKDDFDHWESHGLNQSFEAYIQQKREKVPHDPELRKAWLQEVMVRHKAERGQKKKDSRTPARLADPQTAGSCRKLLETMPLGFNPAAAEDMNAIYQFEISGDERFTAYLKISGGACSFHDGPASRPGVVVKAPADVWLAIGRGKLDGQQAFMAGKYKVEGDLSLLLKFRSLFNN